MSVFRPRVYYPPYQPPPKLLLISAAAPVVAQVWPYLDAELSGGFCGMGMGAMHHRPRNDNERMPRRLRRGTC